MQHEGGLAALQERNEWLEERIAFLERLLVPIVQLPLEWRLTATEARFISALYGRASCSKDQLMAAVYRNDARDEPMEKILDVFACKTRAKMKPFGAGIETEWGRGYRLDAAARAAIDALNAQVPA